MCGNVRLLRWNGRREHDPREQPVPCLLGEVGKWSHLLEAGVVDEDVDPAGFGDRSVHRIS